MNCLAMLTNKTIGIIGLGYIGKNLFNFLNEIKAEYNLTLLTFGRKNTSEIKNYEFDYFFNCTGNTGDFRHKQLETIKSNITLTTFLLENLTIKESYLALSSTRIYGFSSSPESLFSEDYIDNPTHLHIDHIYNGSKKLMESMLINFCPKNACRYSVVRPSNVIGNFNTNDLNDETLFKMMLKNSLNDQVMEINQNQESSKDFIHVDDLVKGMIKAALLPDKSTIFNIGYGKSFSLKEMSQILNLNASFQNNTAASFSNVSIEKSKRMLGFEPSINIEKLSLKNIMGSI